MNRSVRHEIAARQPAGQPLMCNFEWPVLRLTAPGTGERRWVSFLAGNVLAPTRRLRSRPLTSHDRSILPSMQLPSVAPYPSRLRSPLKHKAQSTRPATTPMIDFPKTSAVSTGSIGLSTAHAFPFPYSAEQMGKLGPRSRAFLRSPKGGGHPERPVLLHVGTNMVGFPPLW